MKKTKLSDFVLHQSGRVWVTNSELSFPYSDGDAVETHILNVVQQARNIDIFSQELIGEIRDWPTEYHFSPRRANIIRILTDIGPETRILELGSGCGAITKALAETGCQVDAVEGSFRRASVAAERVRDHANVRVHVSNFQDADFEPIYDVVTLIGVLEYAPAYIDSDDPFVACLKIAASALKPGGVLMVAIENKLGLKYFSGISEDHFSVPYYGVESRYGKREVTTYGKKQLLDRLHRAGFPTVDFYYPYPDYKLPEVILSDRAISHSGFNSSDLVCGLENRDYSGVGKANFRLDLAWESIASEGLLGDLANSFLLIASQNNSVCYLDSTVLAYKFSDTRSPEFNTVTRFIEKNDHIFVNKSNLITINPTQSYTIEQNLVDEEYEFGFNLLIFLRRSLSCARLEEFSLYLKKWIAFIKAEASEDNLLPANFADGNPSNTIVDITGEFHLIDLEWTARKSLDLDFVICRGLLSLVSDPVIQNFFNETDRFKCTSTMGALAGFEIQRDLFDRVMTHDLAIWSDIFSRGKWNPSGYRAASPESSMADEKPLEKLVRALAFHLPQFHAIPENDAWWGKGFTEWDSVRQGKPLFDGHYQPHEPGELGYYDLNDVAVLEKQARLALQYGLEGFCFYYYWFDGKRLLEKPVDQLLAHPEINMPFCLCWANENWTRRWDGGEKEILIQQNYSSDNNERFARDLLPYLRAPRYIRVNGKPLVLVYRADIIPDLPTTIVAWRSTWRTEGIGEVYLVCVESFTSRIPHNDGFDAACEFFPHQLDFSQLSPDERPNHPSDPQANVADYKKLIKFAEARPQPGYKRFRGVIPSWDNAARRRKGGATLFVNASPSGYESWLKNTIRQTLIEQDGDERLVFINAWNEWGEGCHLEPDARYGREWLEATLRALQTAPAVDVHYGRHIQPYQQWRMGRQLDRKELARLANLLGDQIRFTVVIDAVHASTEQLQVTLDSFVGEVYGYYRLLVVSPQSAPSNPSQSVSWLQAEEFPKALSLELAKANSDNWFCLIQAGDQIVESSLLLMAVRLSETPLAGLMYGDEDTIDPKYGPSNPVFRPDFNLDYLRSYPYIGRFLLFRGREHLELGGLDWSAGSARFYDYTLRFYEHFGETAIHHLPTVLFHASQTQYEDAALGNHARVLEAHLQRSRIAAKVDTGLLLGSFRLHYLHQDRPRVSIIIPTKNQLHILRRCLESILENTTYKNYEILIVDNQSTDADAVHYLHGLADLNLPNLHVLSYPHAFNFADMNNLAVREAQGEYLVLLNNDTAIVKADWLEALLNHAQRPEVGIVGAKLLYPDGKVQHGGVILGLRGPADHPFIGKAMDAPGYCGRLLVDQQYSAVTAACMMVRKSVYESVGGMDAESFKVSYNDVDLCLKVREAGYRIIWTPHAMLMHEGSISQKLVDVATQKEKRLRFETEQRAMYHKWLPALIADPAYNPNLSLKGEGFELETNPLFNSYPDLILPKVLAHNGDTYGSGHYRVIQPLQALVELDLGRAAQSDRFLDAIHIAKLAPDVIVLQRQLTDGQLSNIETYREFSGARIVYELDDYLPNLPIASVHKKDFPKDIWRRLRQITALCDRVTVSTPALKTALKDLHSDILVLPNYLPVDWWGDIESRQGFDKKQKPRIGWAGGASHKGDIRLIADVVKALADRVDWVFFGMMPEGVESIVAEYYPGVSIENYPRQLAALNLDLALAPLENNLFNECKSNLRLLEYGICGYPVVATDIAPYRGTLPVTLVKNRFKDWVAAIEEKLADREALLTEGMNLRAAVRNDWMLEGPNLIRWRDGWMLNDIEVKRIR